ncbi:lamin tail domain-containing protein [Thermoproteota archaeon]
MVDNNHIKQLDSLLSNSFNNLKYDTREIYRLINEIKNLLIEAEPITVKDRIAVIENSLQDHVATMKAIQSSVLSLREEIKHVKGADTKPLQSVFRDIKDVLVSNQKEMSKISRSFTIITRSDAERKKEIKELKAQSKNLEKELKKEIKQALKARPKVKIVKVEAKPSAKPVSKKKESKSSKPKPAKKHASERKGIHVSRVQFQAARKGDLNSEWVEISGDGDLNGWTLQDKNRKNTYKFPKGFILKSKVKIHTGTGVDTGKHLYWKSPRAVWNDLSDVAALKNNKGVIVSRVRSERIHSFTALKENNKVNIISVQFESPGSDRDANGEWIEIKGSGRMGGWTLEDKNKKHVYTFPTGFVLNSKVRVYSGRGQDTDTKLFWGNPNPVWNDDHDICTLKHNDGDVVSQVESRIAHNFEILK